MTDEKITVHTLKGFNNEGKYVKRGSPIEVTELRARDLEQNKLITRAAPTPTNKMKRDPTNKGSGDKSPPPPPSAAQALVDGTADVVTKAIGEVTEVDLLRQALEAEQAGKNRKGVSDAISAAIAALG